MARDGETPAPRVLAVVGPTASGKSALADELATRLGSAVVSADAMQVYRGMDIGTAKTPVSERPVPLLCVDIADPTETFSVAEFQRHAHRDIDALVKKGRVPVVCGGTGLYVRAALEDMAFPAGEQDENPVRAHYQQLAAQMGNEAFHALLAARDPQSAALIHPNNVRRVVRAFELLEQGTSYAREHATLHVRTYRWPVRIFGLRVSRDLLYARINARVDAMLARGLLDEVSRLLATGYGTSTTSVQAIGYKEILDALRACGVTYDEAARRGITAIAAESATLRAALDAAVEEVKLRSRRYAKRQMTWFRSNEGIVWLDADDAGAADLADEVMRSLGDGGLMPRA